MADKSHANSIHHGLKPGDARHPPYTPADLGRELGIMFGFIALCGMTMLIYWFVWQAAQRRNAIREAARLEAVATRARARAEEEKQRLRDAKGVEMKAQNNSNMISGSPICERSRKLRRNGAIMNDLDFEDLDEELVV